MDVRRVQYHPDGTQVWGFGGAPSWTLYIPDGTSEEVLIFTPSHCLPTASTMPRQKTPVDIWEEEQLKPFLLDIESWESDEVYEVVRPSTCREVAELVHAAVNPLSADRGIVLGARVETKRVVTEIRVDVKKIICPRYFGEPMVVLGSGPDTITHYGQFTRIELPMDLNQVATLYRSRERVEKRIQKD